MVQHLKIKIYGRVQMVGFRYAASRKARELGVNGFVRNKDDGAVYVEAEAEKENLEKFLAWCRRGPLWARVKKVEYKYEDKIKNYQGFVIEY